MKKLRDCLHFYYGCNVVIKPNEKNRRVGKFVGFANDHRISVKVKFRAGPDGQVSLLFIKPVLKRLSDITQEDYDLIEDIDTVENETHSYESRVRAMTEVINTLRGMWYDCDGLIEAGLAIDRNTLNQHLYEMD